MLHNICILQVFWVQKKHMSYCSVSWHGNVLFDFFYLIVFSITKAVKLYHIRIVDMRLARLISVGMAVGFYCANGVKVLYTSWSFLLE